MIQECWEDLVAEEKQINLWIQTDRGFTENERAYDGIFWQPSLAKAII